MNPPRSTWTMPALALVVALVAVWTCAPCLQGGFLTNMDDDVYLAAAQRYNGVSTAGLRWALTEVRPYYQLLPRLSHLLAYNIWGARPAGHHAVNLSLHACNAVLATILAWVLLGFGLPAKRESPPASGHSDSEKSLWVRMAAAGFVGLVFAVHPLQAESVAWVAGRTQLLCTALMLGCVLAYVQAVRTGRRGCRWAAAVMFVMAWLSKPIVATLPFVLIVLDWFPLRRHVALGWRTLVREKLWMFALSAGLTVLTYFFALREGIFGDAESPGLVERVFVAECAIGFYLWKLVWPAWLSPFYPAPLKITMANTQFYGATLLLATVVFGVWSARRRLPALAATGVAFIALLLPMSGLTQFGGETIANRHMYVAMLPLALLAAGAGAWLWLRASVAGRAALITISATALFWMGGQTRAEVRMWRDDETLWRSTLRWFPAYGFGNQKVAVACVARRDFAAALPFAERALEAQPHDGNVRELLGSVYLKTGNYEAAVRTLQPLLQADVWQSGAWYSLACALARLGSNDMAIAVLREVLPREPRLVDLAGGDPELAGLRGDPRFADILGKVTP